MNNNESNRTHSGGLQKRNEGGNINSINDKSQSTLSTNCANRNAVSNQYEEIKKGNVDSNNAKLVTKQHSINKNEKLTQRLVEFDKRNLKGSKKKGKKSFKWDKSANTQDLLGFDEYGASPFDTDRGYNLNEVEYVHFSERPARRQRTRSSNFSASQHVQANHRFILKPNRHQDYLFATYDPDYQVDWSEIFMVHAKRNTQYLCPICREENLVAPVISKCGHIFCWP